jgi:Ca-activated chloride channel homolog
MLQRIAVTAAVVCTWCAVPVGAQELPRFKSSVDLVPISAVVRDTRGRPIRTLSAADFEVRDNGELRPILRFELDDGSPLTVAVLADTSGSMRLTSKLEAARQVVRELAAELQEGRDEVGLFTFDGALHELQPFTQHPATVSTALVDADPFGVTSLYDAIAETAQRLSARPSKRRAIIVLTDGVDTSSALAPAEVSARASAVDAPVYIVATVPRIDRASYFDRAAAPNARATADARDLALWTGGDLLWATNNVDAAACTRHIVAELRQQYLLAIEAAPVGDWRALDVKVRDRRLNVRARGGYYGRDGGSDR